MGRTGTSRTPVLAALAVAPVLCAVACSDGASGGGDEECADYPGSDIEFIVPYSAGGGFDTWARVIAPELADDLGVNVPVANRDGAGGITGVTEVFGTRPDGSTIVITEPGILATAQLTGTSDLDFAELDVVGRVAVGPEVIVVRADSEWDTIEDVQAAAGGGPVLMGTGGLAAVNIISFDELGIPFENVSHDGSSEALLSVVRGDTAIALFPLASVAEGIRAGDLKPLLLVGTPPGEDNPDADVVAGVPTLDEATGQDGLGAALEQHRIVATAPDTPQCIVESLSESMAAAFQDDGLVGDFQEAGLVPAHMDAAEAQEVLQSTIDTLTEYEDLLSQSFEG
ncbi:Bug family tripartite tricarboxylate transporter substrate binding protein [Jiangella asiatica]|nr:tripartite tricarboxylate transporter substrate binding protein [Jiangella asiatica]